jgi:hypothetical protein
LGGLKAAADKAAAGGGVKHVAAAAQGKASAFFKGPLKSFTIIGMEVKGSSMTFDGVWLCVPLPCSVCRNLWPPEAEMMCVCVQFVCFVC